MAFSVGTFDMEFSNSGVVYIDLGCYVIFFNLWHLSRYGDERSSAIGNSPLYFEFPTSWKISHCRTPTGTRETEVMHCSGPFIWGRSVDSFDDGGLGERRSGSPFH